VVFEKLCNDKDKGKHKYRQYS